MGNHHPFTCPVGGQAHGPEGSQPGRLQRWWRTRLERRLARRLRLTAPQQARFETLMSRWWAFREDQRRRRQAFIAQLQGWLQESPLPRQRLMEGLPIGTPNGEREVEPLVTAFADLWDELSPDQRRRAGLLLARGGHCRAG